MKCTFMYIVLMISAFAFSQQFTEVNSGIPVTYSENSEWGDLDNDGDLDLVTVGDYSKIYRNDGAGVFTDAGFETWYNPINVDLGDYDNDGDLDILFSGMDATIIFRNNGNWTFTQLTTAFPYGHEESNAVWGDYDNDGDLDIVLTGWSSVNLTGIYRNDGNGVFTGINAGLIGLDYSTVYWVDYNCDGLLDVMLIGEDMAGMTGYRTILYKNDGNGLFTDINAVLPGVFGSSVDWGDYDNDGDPDLLLTGSYASRIFRNDGNGIFTETSAGLYGVSDGNAEWGDFDNDGDLDIVISGLQYVSYPAYFYAFKVYRNNGNGTFTDIFASLYSMWGKPIWGDFDNDGDLDIFIIGKYQEPSWNYVSKLYRNNCTTPNTVPSKPTGLLTEIVGDSLYLSFPPSTDAETLQAALTYNIDIDQNSAKYLSGMSDLTNGYRKIVKEGNLSYRTNYSIYVFSNLPQETQENQEERRSISWKVQAIDNCFAGSGFAADSISIPLVLERNLTLQNNFLMTEFDLLKWEYAFPDTVDHYVVQIDEDSLFNSPLEHSYTMSKTGKIITFLSVPVQDFSGYETMRSHNTYFWRVKPVYINGSLPTVFSKIPASFIYIPYDIAPGTPQNFTITHVSSNIVLTWNAVEVKQKGVTYNVYSSADPYAEFPAGFILEQSGITTTAWSKPVSVDKKFYLVTAYYSLQ